MSYPILREDAPVANGHMNGSDTNSLTNVPREDERRVVWAELVKVKSASVLDLSLRTRLPSNIVQSAVNWLEKNDYVSVFNNSGISGSAVIAKPSAIFNCR